jgi:hypothetical protein
LATNVGGRSRADIGQRPASANSYRQASTRNTCCFSGELILLSGGKGKAAKPEGGRGPCQHEALRSFADSFHKEKRMKDERGLTVFNDGSKMSLAFPKQSLNETASVENLRPRT